MVVLSRALPLYSLDAVSVPEHDVVPEGPEDIQVDLPDVGGRPPAKVLHRLQRGRRRAESTVSFSEYRRFGKFSSLINFRQYPMTTKIKNTTIFQHRIIRTKLHFRYAEATKIKQCENLTDEYFYERKFPDLR